MNEHEPHEHDPNLDHEPKDPETAGMSIEPMAPEHQAAAPTEQAESVPADAHPVRDDRAVMPAAQVKAAQRNGPDDVEVEDQIHQMSRRSFLWGALALGATYGGVRWIGSRRLDEGVPWPLRRGLELNEGITRDLTSPKRMSPRFAAARAREIRVNGDLGMDEGFDPAHWHLSVKGLADENATGHFSLVQIKALPRVTMTTEHKCIEGWATVVTWSGARLSDFIQKYPPATTSGDPLDLRKHPEDLPEYVGLETPGGGYYVGLEREAALHPQTLLCYEMNGQPLTLEHGAPLRLVVPVKYGTKSIKRIGTLRFVAQRPADYWAQQGYDYNGGL